MFRTAFQIRRGDQGDDKGVARGGDRYAYGEKREGKRPLGIPRCRWDDNTTMEMKAIELDGTDTNNLVEDSNKRRAVVKTVMKLGVQ